MLQVAAFSPNRLPAEPANALLDELGPVEGLHALIIGASGLDTMCELIRRGCAAAVESSFGDPLWPQAGSADVAVVPNLTSRAEAQDAVARGWRALIMGGRIALRDATGQMRPLLATLLRTNGFCAVRTRLSLTGTIMTAERPLFGPLPRV